MSQMDIGGEPDAGEQRAVAMEDDAGERQSGDTIINELIDLFRKLFDNNMEGLDQIRNGIFSQWRGQGPVEADDLGHVSNPQNLEGSWELAMKIFIENCTDAAKHFSKYRTHENVSNSLKKGPETTLDLIRKLLELGRGGDIVDTLESFESDKTTSLHSEPFIMLNAVVCMFGSEEIRRAGYNVMIKICFNVSRLFLFVAISESLRNYLPEEDTRRVRSRISQRSKRKNIEKTLKKATWEPMRKKAVAQFYMRKKCPMKVLYETTQCMQRYNVTHRSVLGKCRPKPKDPEKISYDLVFCYLTRGFKGIVKKYPSLKDGTMPTVTQPVSRSLRAIKSLNDVKKLDFNTENTGKLLGIIKEFQEQDDEYNDEGRMELVDKKFTFLLSHIPSQFFRKPEVWKDLLQNTPIGPLIFNLNRFTMRVLPNDGSVNEEMKSIILSVLKDKEKIPKQPPLKYLKVAKYFSLGETTDDIKHRNEEFASGHRLKFKWEPVPEFIDALLNAFVRCEQLYKIKERSICYVIDTNKERMVDAHLQKMHSVNPIDCACAITYKMWSENKDNRIFHAINNNADSVQIIDFHGDRSFRSLLEMSKMSSPDAVLQLDKIVTSTTIKNQSPDIIVVLTDRYPPHNILQESSERLLTGMKMIVCCLNEYSEEKKPFSSQPLSGVKVVSGFDNNTMDGIVEYICK